MNELDKLLEFSLNERIKLVRDDFSSGEDKYALIEPFVLAEVLGVPLSSIDGSGEGNWADWGCYGYVYLDAKEELQNSLNIALEELYHEDINCGQMATYDVDVLRFEASLNGDYSTIDELKTPYELKKSDLRFWYWNNDNFHKMKKEDILNLPIKPPIKEVWLEANKDTTLTCGSLIEFDEKIKWLKLYIKTNFDICIYRFFNDEY